VGRWLSQLALNRQRRRKLKIHLRVKFNDGQSHDADAVFADFVAFERTWNRSVAQLENDLRLTDLAWLAWHSEKRRGLTQEPFDPTWLNTVELVEPRDTEDQEATVPLDKAPSSTS
jgi:hypothetical protein